MTNPQILHTLTSQIGEALTANRMMLVTAESCTGGGLAYAITHIPGASTWFERGLIAYSNTAKQNLLAVKIETLLQFGAVSKQTAIEMAQGALLHSPAQISIAITGIAGPEGGEPQKPVGTVWIAWVARGAHHAHCFYFEGDRNAIQEQAIYHALEGLHAILLPDSTQMAPILLPPVITLDGPGGTGKGTLSQLIAQKLGWHYLDSGILFRVLAHAALKAQVNLEDENTLAGLAETLYFQFVENGTQTHILLDNEEVTAAIRLEDCGNAASKIGVFPKVRQAIAEHLRSFRKWPGLVTDGRDMGTVIFPSAILKFFLYADQAERAKRRERQLNKQGTYATFTGILQNLAERDKRDQERDTAPLKSADDAILVDTTALSIEASLSKLMTHINDVFPINT